MLQKLEILKEANLINQDVYDYIIATMALLEKEGIELHENDGAETFLTHLAMAATRQSTDEKIEPLDELLYNELIEDSNFPYAIEIWKKINNISPISFGETELNYFYVHLCSMLE